MVSTPVYPRLLKPPRESFFLFGVRGVGKSTWAESRFREARRVNLLDEGVHHSFLADPSQFAAELMDLRRGQWVVVPAKWRKYPTWQASVDDHAAFLKRNPRYKDCFLCVSAQTFARALLKAGYATDPDYADKLIRLIGTYSLASLDGEGV